MKHKGSQGPKKRFLHLGMLLFLCFCVSFFAISEPLPAEVLYSDAIRSPEDIVLTPAFSAEAMEGGGVSALGAPGPAEGIADRPAYMALGFQGICKAVFMMDGENEYDVVYSGTNVDVNETTGAYTASKPGAASITATAAGNPSKRDTWNFEVIELKVQSISIHGFESAVIVGDSGQAFAQPKLSLDVGVAYGSKGLIDEFSGSHGKVRWSGVNIEIDQDTGEWRAVKAGKASIHAVLDSDNSVFATLNLTVYAIDRIQIDKSHGYSSGGIGFDVFAVLKDGTTHKLSPDEFTSFGSDNLQQDSVNFFRAVAAGPASITVVYSKDRSVTDTWELNIAETDVHGALYLNWCNCDMIPVGETMDIRISPEGMLWSVTHSDNLKYSISQEADDVFTVETLSAGDAWVEVTATPGSSGDPMKRKIQFEIIEEVPSSVKITSVTIDGKTYSDQESFPQNVSTAALIVPTATIYFPDGHTRDVPYEMDSGYTSSPIIWGAFNAQATPEGIQVSDSADNAMSALTASYRLIPSIQNTWSFAFSGALCFEPNFTFYDGPLRMYVGDVISLENIMRLRFTNAKEGEGDTRCKWEIIPYSVNASIVNNESVKALEPGMIWIRQTSIQNSRVAATIRIWAETPCCLDYKSCPACLASPDFHNSTYCICKHNFPFYCPLCKGPCGKYAKADANGYFHTVVGSSLLSNGAFSVGSTEVRELRIPQGARASCCKNPCPSCLYSESNCSGSNCTCSHDFPKYCPICLGPCQSFQTFGPDGKCHYTAEDGRIKALLPSPQLTPLPATGDKNVCEACQKYRVEGTSTLDKSQIVEISLYAGGLACKCKPRFPAYCPYCLGPCKKAAVLPEVNEYHYLSYKADYTELIHDYWTIGENAGKNVTLVGCVIRRIVPVLPVNGDVTFTPIANQNSALDPRSALKTSFLDRSSNATVNAIDQEHESDPPELTGSPLSAGGASVSAQKPSGANAYRLWLGGGDAAFFTNTDLIEALKKEIGVTLSICAVTGQDLELALENDLSSPVPPDAVLLPIERLRLFEERWTALDSWIEPALPYLSNAFQRPALAALSQGKAGTILYIPLPSLAGEEGPLDERSLALAICATAKREEKAAFVRMMEYLYTQEGRNALMEAAK